MKKYFEEIEKKLKDNIKIEEITIVDNSYRHKNHKFFSKDKFHYYYLRLTNPKIKLISYK